MNLDWTPAAWQAWCFAILALALVMAVESDLRTQRIPNLVVSLMLCSGVLLQTLGPANGREGLFSQFPGALGAVQSSLGVLVGLALFLPLYWLRAMGAGDVKLLAALGAFVGPTEVIGLALCILATGGVLAWVIMLWSGKSHAVLGHVKLVLGRWAGTHDLAFDPATQSVVRMPYALAIGVGALVYAYWRLVGGAPLVAF